MFIHLGLREAHNARWLIWAIKIFTHETESYSAVTDKADEKDQS